MRHRIANILFSIAMLVVAAVLAVSAALICCVKILKPERLTPLVEYVLNKTLDADVDVARVELAFKPVFPILSLEVDSLSVISNAFDSIPSDQRDAMPVWADSLLAFDHFSGAIDMGALLKGEIAVHDVIFVRPAVNLAIAANGKGNFEIYQTVDSVSVVEDTHPAEPLVIPPFSISRFELVEPHEIRYFSAADSVDASVVLFKDARLLNEGRPSYSIRIDGQLSSPLTKAALNLENMTFGLDGKICWDPGQPSRVAFEQFDVNGAFVNAKFDGVVNYDTTLVVESAALSVGPVKITDMLTVLPDSLRRANRLVTPYFATDGEVTMQAELLRPFNLATDSLPAGRVNISMPDCSFRYGKATFKKVGFDISATLPAPSLDSAFVDINRITVAGPATQLDLSGRVSSLLNNPAFIGAMKGNIDLSLFPPIITDMLGGSLRGRVNADFTAAGRMSMLNQTEFHKLDVRGKVSGRNIVYRSTDTTMQADIHHADIRFGSKVRARRDSGATVSAPMLAASIVLDTARFVLDGVDVYLADMSLAAGVENFDTKGDTTLVVPIGGGIKISRLNFASAADSTAIRLRKLSGRVNLRRFKGLNRVPELNADLEIGNVAAAAAGSKIVFSKAHFDAKMFKLPNRNRRAMTRMLDSISAANPRISKDSVMQLALAEQRAHVPARQRSVSNKADVEMIEWGMSTGFKRFMLGWRLDGAMSTKSARLYTPYFPIRNSIKNLDLKFNNDSVQLNNVRYKAGRSDITVSGLISNLRRGLTSRHDNNIKIAFSAESDTIDVNQLAAATFAGAAYAERVNKGTIEVVNFAEQDDTADDTSIDAMAQDSDTIGPLLIPVNIDVQLHLKAKTMIYADIAMTDMHGDILVYNGGVNLQHLSASSDAGAIRMSALYSAPRPSNMHFGFGLDMERIDVERFLKLVPAIDSVMPMMSDFRGIIDAEMAATVDIDTAMNLVLPTLDAAVRLSGDSLEFVNKETYAMMGKWLRFRDRADNRIKHMNVELIVRDDVLQIFPFAFDIDRYRLGVSGSNDLNFNFDYHISVLKSPLPFKFGVNVKGNPDKYKVRLGGAKYKEGQAIEQVSIVDTARVNLINQLEGVFRRGVDQSKFSRLEVSVPKHLHDIIEQEPVLTSADSAALIREGIIETPVDSIPTVINDDKQ